MGSSLQSAGDWLAANAVWLFPAIWATVTGWKEAKGSKAQKSWDGAVRIHEQAKRAQFDAAAKKLGDAAGELDDAWVREIQAKAAQVDANLLRLAPKKRGRLAR